MTQQIQPIFILPEGSQRTTGKNAQRTNIAAAQAVAETVRTTLGPKGMDKMLVDSLGDVVVTNDGVTILDEMSIEHPSAKMIVEVAKTQENEVGDGTTTAVVLAGELLKKAEILLDQNIHPTVIAKGYRLASEKSMAILRELAEKVSEDDNEILENIGITAMTGKGAEAAKEILSKLSVNAVKCVMVRENKGVYIDRGAITIEKKTGASVEDSELVMGILLDKERVHPGMPRVVKNAKIALVDSAVEVKSTETDAKIQIDDPGKMQAFIDMEEKMIRDKVNKIAASGANVLLCQKGIDDLAQHFLAKKGIFAARRIKKSDMENLAKATGASIVTNLDDLSEKDLGRAGVVEEQKVGDEEMTFVKECKEAKAVSILIRGGTDHVIDEVKRAMEDAIGDISAALTEGKIVAGAGATEIELAKGLRKYAESLSGREQLAAASFADAVEIIPRTLAENSGLDPIDVMAALKSAHDKGEKTAGINVYTGKVMDARAAGVIEPLKIKTQAVSSAAEVAIMILRIDDLIASSGSSRNEQMPPGMPPGGM
ncbi:MAG: thermosome subunit beta [archaeon]